MTLKILHLFLLIYPSFSWVEGVDPCLAFYECVSYFAEKSIDWYLAKDHGVYLKPLFTKKVIDQNTVKGAI